MKGRGDHLTVGSEGVIMWSSKPSSQVKSSGLQDGKGNLYNIIKWLFEKIRRLNHWHQLLVHPEEQLRPVIYEEVESHV